MRTLVVHLVLIGILWPGGAARGGDAGRRDILNAKSFWRWHVTLRSQVKGKSGVRRMSPSAPADWMKPEFDDLSWPRGTIQDLRPLVAGKHNGPLLLRGKFRAADPASVGGLTLTVETRCRVTASLNGKRVAVGRLSPRDLRRGVNVLAVEISGLPVDVRGVRLQAAGGGVAANVARPKGLQVWMHDINDRVCVTDYGDPCEEPRVRIVAARNTSHAGQLVVGSPGPIRGLRVIPGDLKTAGGAVIAAEHVTVLYGRLDDGAYGKAPWCDGLSETRPDEVPVVKLGWRVKVSYGARVPVWIRIRVPRDAAPGEYRGTVTLSAAGAKERAVPVELYVADWVCPDPQRYRTYMGIYQSPTSLALRYKVTEWSEEHWTLMEPSLALLARVGNKFANVTVVEQTQFGNDRGMVYWIRKPDGTFGYDFTVFDRYMQLVKKHFGVVDYVALQVWHSGGWATRKADQKNTVTVLDRKTGRYESLQVPTFGTEASKRFWKPVLDALRRRLARLGMEKAMTLGILSDGTAPPAVFTAFDQIVPGGAKWMRGLHSTTGSRVPYRLKGGGRVVLHEHCYGMSMVRPWAPLPPIWTQRGWPGTAYFRIAPYENRVSLIAYRIMAEQALFTRKQGVGRICLDFWPVISRGKRARTHLYNRYPHSSCAQRAPALYRLTWPGPKGAETTARFEVLCEGVQEAEAMIVLSEAADKHTATLGEPLAATCRRILRDRLLYCHTRNYQRWSYVHYHMNHYRWQDLSRRLYDCAAEVSGKLRR